MHKIHAAAGRSGVAGDPIAGEGLVHQADRHHPVVFDRWFVRSHSQSVSFRQAIGPARKQQAVTGNSGGAEHQRVPHVPAQARVGLRHVAGGTKAADAGRRLS